MLSPIALRRRTSVAYFVCCVAAFSGCESLDPGAMLTTSSEPSLPSPEQTAKFDNPIAVSQLREQALAEIGDRAIDPRAELRANALEAMLLTPARLEQFIPAGLKDENVGVRSTAAVMVGKLRLQSLTALVRPLLDDPSPFVRASAIFALSRNGHEINPSPLAEIILNDPSPRARAHVAYLLGEMGDPTALGMLRDAAKASIARAQPAEIQMMQVQLAEAMVKLGDEGKIEAIRASLYPTQPGDLEVAALAVQVIGELRDKSSASELIYLTAYRTRTGERMPAEIRLGAAAAMAKLGNTRGSFIADEFLTSEMAPLRAQAAYVYGETRRRENLAKLEQLLADPEARVRVAAAAAVLKITSGSSL